MVHGRVISHNEIKCIGTRDSYITSDTEFTDDLKFLPTHLYETNLQDVKYAKSTYKIILSGVCTNGKKISVVLDQIEPYFEVMICGEDEEQFVDDLLNKLANQNPCLSPDGTQGTGGSPIKIIKGKPFKYYQTHQDKFIRLYYTKTYIRKAAINHVLENSYEIDEVKYAYMTAVDDLSCYYRVVCRDYLTTFSSWVNIKKYTVVPSGEILKGTTIRCSINDYIAVDEKEISENKLLVKDKTLGCCWDIETWSASGEIPTPDNIAHKVFCISVCFQWIHEKQSFLRIALCTLPSNATKDCLTVICPNEKQLLLTFAEILGRMCPDYIYGFNDSDYDWPWIIKRAVRYRGVLAQIAKNLDLSVPYAAHTDEQVMQKNYRFEHIKLEASAYADGHTLQLNGYIPVDVRTIYRKLYPTSEQSSLKFFLDVNKLGSKEDMAYTRMHDVCSEFFAMCEKHPTWSIELKTDDPRYEFLKQEMAEINKYCVIDAVRCHDLMRMRNVIMDHREVANLSYVSMYDAFYRANGVKVRNLTIAIGQQKPFRIRFTNISNADFVDQKFVGALVYPPKKGLKISKLSLDERIQKAKLQGQNVPEWLHESHLPNYYEFIKKHGCVCQVDQLDADTPQEFKDFLMEPTGRPISGLDFSSLYPSLIRAYNFSPEYCITDINYAKRLHAEGVKLNKVDFDFGGRRVLAYFVWHNKIYNKTEPGFQFGVFPYVLNDLFNKRKALKAQLEPIETQLEHNTKHSTLSESQVDDLTFMFSYLNVKQTALKVFMNTFYGVAGNKISPFFLVEVAGGVTTYGQRNLQLGYKCVTENGCCVYYGDTDSLYISMPETCFAEIDKLYYTAQMDKLVYWTKLVEITFSYIKIIQSTVNDMFAADNNTHFLSMAYEEVLFPSMYTAKKKYYGTQHKKTINFYPKEQFIRGLEIKKRGVSEFAKKCITDIMWKTCDAKNLLTPIELALQKIDYVYSAQWEYSDFIQTDVYRPAKNNVKIHTFVARMEELGIHVKPHERFNYIIAKKYPYKYDYRGRKSELSIGDKMELATSGIQIDLDHYMSHGVNNQLGRLITYHDMFYVQPADCTVDNLHVAELKIYKNACKYIDDYCTKYYSSYNTFGKVHQKIYKEVNKRIMVKVDMHVPQISKLLNVDVDLEDFENNLFEMASNEAKKRITRESHGVAFVNHALEIFDKTPAGKRSRNLRIAELQTQYYGRNGFQYQRERKFNEVCTALRNTLRDNFHDIVGVYINHRKYLTTIIDKLKPYQPQDTQPTPNARTFQPEDFDERYDEIDNLSSDYVDKLCADYTALYKFQALYSRLYCAYYTWYQTVDIVDYLRRLHKKINNIVDRPVNIGETIRNDVDESAQSVDITF
jgi:DNA polymerase elongation subunit (family B)